MRSGQLWVGQGSPYQPQVYGWSKDWQAVVIKTIPWTEAAQQEEDALLALQVPDQPGPCYVTQLLGSFTVPTGPNNQESLCLVTKYAACPLLSMCAGVSAMAAMPFLCIQQDLMTLCIITIMVR